MDTDYQRLATHVEGLRHTVYGNGQTGLSESVRHIQEDLGEIRKTVEKTATKTDALERARERDANLREGSKRTLIALGAVVTILSGGGVAIGVRVLKTLAELAQALP